MLRLTSDVPPSMVLARLRSMPAPRRAASRRTRRAPFAHAVAPAPSRSVAQQLDALVELGAVDLADRALGPGRSTGLRALARTRWFVHSRTFSSLHSRRQPLAHDAGRRRDRARRASRRRRPTPEPPMRSTPPEPEPDTICRSPDSVAFATFHPSPTVAHPLAVGHARAVEEHLVEVDLAADVAQRAHRRRPAGCRSRRK